MSKPLRKSSPFYLIGALLLLGLIYSLLTRPPQNDPAPELPPPDPRLASLGQPPDWTTLSRYDGVLTRREFETILHEIYLLGENIHFTLTDEEIQVSSQLAPPGATIAFATRARARKPPRYWRPARELPPAPPGQPLHSLSIAIDPGHIGGKWARMEERWYQLGETTPVTEGDMTLLTARLLAPRLEQLGASVTLVRKTPDPVTRLRPVDFVEYAAGLFPGAPEHEILTRAERFFYRTAEIRARATLVNETIRPDLVLCLHFNAENWGKDPTDPSLSPRNHFHMILHGAYMDGEIAHEDERCELLHKIFQRVHREEAALAAALATSFMKESSLPAYDYHAGKPARQVGPALWARNLLANRLYQCPVLFFEPYVMNNAEVHARVQAGDYTGQREVAGSLRKSIYREYVDAVVDGMATYYEAHRESTQPTPPGREDPASSSSPSSAPSPSSF